MNQLELPADVREHIEVFLKCAQRVDADELRSITISLCKIAFTSGQIDAYGQVNPKLVAQVRAKFEKPSH